MPGGLLLAAAGRRGGPPTEWVDPWAIAGDTGNRLSSLSITGADVTNTDSGVLYWTILSVFTTKVLNIFDDFAKTNRVLFGSRVGGGTIVLSQDNGSGLSGSVVHSGATGSDIDSGNTFVGTPV